MHKSFFKAILFCVTAALFVSCDKDFNEIGSDIVDNDHYGFEMYDDASVVAYNQRIGAVQTNKTTSSTVNLPVNTLGYYSHHVFGKTTASFVTQLELATVNPTFGINPVIKNVVLTIPYFSHLDDTNDDGSHTYILDSLRGSEKIKLSVYASNYYLRDLDPATGFQESQKYYSDQTPDFDANIDATPVSVRLNDSVVPGAGVQSQNNQFFFDPAEIVTYKTVDGAQEVDKRIPPQMQLSLNKAFFQNKIFGSGAAGNLVNNNLFKEYFRGLYFKAEATGQQGSMAQLNFKQGKVTITYMVNTSSTDTTPIEKTFVLNMAGNTVNVFENQDNPNYVNAVTNTDPVNGDQKLYVKGGQGSMAVIDLFGKTDNYSTYVDDDNDSTTPKVPSGAANGVPDQLDYIRSEGWLINDAMLTFWIDRSSDAMAATVPELNRIYLYDLTNNRPLVDYYTDVSTYGSDPKRNKDIHGGILIKDTVLPVANRRGLKYSIRITNHIKNLVKDFSPNDSTNVRLGLVVTESINNVSNAKLKTPILSGGTIIDRVPAASVGNPLGTVLYGSHPAVAEDKRLKLVIYYTKPN
jgi:hypothetical protein